MDRSIKYGNHDSTFHKAHTPYIRCVSSPDCFCFSAFAGEGMWLPFLLKSLNEAEMKSMGMKMSAEDIYSVNQGSLKDAVVHFGGFCTGELISDQGLLLTNHHCGYDAIQGHSTLENNYIKNGFWAGKNQKNYQLLVFSQLL